MPTPKLTAGGLLVVLAALVNGACVSAPEPMRGGGTSCTTSDDCNPSGQRCGAIYLCVNTFCTTSTVVRACSDGGVSGDASVGNCISFEDCNPLPHCGNLVACVSNQCDESGPRVAVPCGDSGMPDAQAADAARDARPNDGG